MMARHGRHNRIVPSREPSGRLQREPITGSLWRRLLSDIRERSRSEWGDQLGRLFLQQALSEGQYEAGRKWREMAARYRASLGVFPVRSAALEVGIHSTQPDPDSPAGQRQAKRERRAIEEFIQAHVMLVNAGCGAERAVEMLVERDEPLNSYPELLAARRGLAALEIYYSSLRRDKNRSNSNVRTP